MICDRCEEREATVCVWDEPENASGLMFGDELAGRLLCGPCLLVTEADGPWHGVEVLDEALPAPPIHRKPLIYAKEAQ